MSRKLFHLPACLLIVMVAISDSQASPPELPAVPEGISAVVQFGQGVFLTDADLQAIAERIEQGREPTFTAYQALLREAPQMLAREPAVPQRWYVPGYYRDAEGHIRAKEALQHDANTAYQLALLYRIEREPAYAEAAVRLIDAWSALEELDRRADSTLSFSYHFPAMIFAADLLRGSEHWSAEGEARFAAFVRERALPMNTMGRKNNWGNWGLVLVLASAAYLEDEELFSRGVERWMHFIESQIADDGHLPHEVTRNKGLGERGIWYTHFTLMPQTLAAEIARANGVDLYDYTSPSGRTLRQAFHRVAPWACEPASFPYFTGDDPAQQAGTHYIAYFEILQPRWPHPDAAAMLAQRRPITAAHSAPMLTLTHGQPLTEDTLP